MRIRIRDPESFWPWIRDPGWKKFRFRDIHSGSAALYRTVHTSTYLFIYLLGKLCFWNIWMRMLPVFLHAAVWIIENRCGPYPVWKGLLFPAVSYRYYIYLPCCLWLLDFTVAICVKRRSTQAENFTFCRLADWSILLWQGFLHSDRTPETSGGPHGGETLS